MIRCEGIKAFHGKATIRPQNPMFAPYEVSGDWVYKPECDCWYCKGSSYPASVVMDVVEEVSGRDLIEELKAHLSALEGIAVNGGNIQELNQILINTRTWLTGVEAKM